MRHRHCMTKNMMRNIEKGGKCEMHTVGHEIWVETLDDLEYGEKTEKKNTEKESQTLFDLDYGKKHSKNVANGKCTLQDMKYGKKQ